jgi:glycosyltransferase involved in cell wall biosynthesis
MLRVLLLNNVPAPYFDPLFEKIGEESGWDLTVCYVSDWNKDVGWRENFQRNAAAHRTIILDRRHPALREKLGSSPAAAVALAWVLLRERPDYLICYGYTMAPQTIALLWAMATGTPFALIGDANYFTDTATGMRRLVKGAWLRWLAAHAAALIAIGSANRRFWESYGAGGAGAGKIFEAGFAVDNEFFAEECGRRKTEADRLKARLGLSGKTVFLFVGRLVRRKNVDLIIRAARSLGDDRIAIVIAGSGEERVALEKLAGGDPALASRIVFAGNVSPDELPLYYALSDALALPASQEPWGLVINEAMASGLAVIAHRHCGAAMDLVEEDNGAALKTFSVEELSDVMKSMAGDRARLDSMRSRSLDKIKAWSIPAAARGIIRAVETTAGGIQGVE